MSSLAEALGRRAACADTCDVTCDSALREVSSLVTLSRDRRVRIGCMCGFSRFGTSFWFSDFTRFAHSPHSDSVSALARRARVVLMCAAYTAPDAGRSLLYVLARRLIHRLGPSLRPVLAHTLHTHTHCPAATRAQQQASRLCGSSQGRLVQIEPARHRRPTAPSVTPPRP